MKSNHPLPRSRHVVILLAALLLTGLTPLLAATTESAKAVPPSIVAATPVPRPPQLAAIRRYGFDLKLGRNVITVRWLAPDILRIHYLPNAQANPRTPVLRQGPLGSYQPQRPRNDAAKLIERSPKMQVTWNKTTSRLSVDSATGRHLLSMRDLATLAGGTIRFAVSTGDPLYGIGGYQNTSSSKAGILRRGTWLAKAGNQGYSGAPWVWSTAGYGLLFDTLGARFQLNRGTIHIGDFSRKDIDLFILTGNPDQLFSALAGLSGYPPMYPKWAMGFMNSQWGINQKELMQIIDTYRAQHIPIDNFILDFDWKAWGQNHYGEFRWNTKKFPDGPDGKLARWLRKRGVHLSGIMKPRIHVHTIEGHYASEHNFWFPGEKPEKDYFSHQLVEDLNFAKPAMRKWFFNPVLRKTFESGMVGWWNDEADDTPSDTQFMNMQRALYNGQRRFFKQRVWSLNRDFYLGAQRYAYGLWSGDINTGFASMAAQRERLLSAINVGEMRWGMDAGGFHGHPTPQNYARWLEFAAFVPIFRVHGTHNQHRQPWVYGAVAEKAAVHAIRLRYRLLPYIYSYQWQLHTTGIGIVRPLIFAFPNDPRVRNDINSWLFGHWLLVSPIVKPDATRKRVYLPAGTWTDYFSGKVYHGKQTVSLAVDSKTWMDIPLFIRQGAIIPTQPVLQYVGQHPVTTVTVDVFPATRRSRFDYYADQGDTYAYEHGDYFLQTLSTQKRDHSITFSLSAPQGNYRPALRDYLVKIHGLAAHTLRSVSGKLPFYQGLDALRKISGEGWATGHDRYGPLTYLKLDAGKAHKILLRDNG